MKCYQCQSTIADDAEICPRCKAPQGFSRDMIDEAMRGDQAAITELYNRTYSSVYHTVKSILRDDDTALDVLQDSYLKAFRRLDQLGDPSKFRAWVKRIARNQAVDVLRQKSAIPFSALESDEDAPPIEFEDTVPEHLPDVVIDRQETARLMREILDALPDDQRAAISMFYYEEMSVREIADALGVPENTVKSRLNYGRKKIEAEVRALEKRGTRLYGLAPVPFLLLLFRSRDACAEVPAATVRNHLTAELTAKTAASAAARTAGKVTAKAAGHALRNKIIAGVTAAAVAGGGGMIAYERLANRPASPEQQSEETVPEELPAEREEQLLPSDFLADMEALAAEKLASFADDREYLELHWDQSTYDVVTESIRAENAQLDRDAVFYETGGTAALFILYRGDVRIDDSWYGFIINRIPHEYPDAAIVFRLDSFPLKFLRADGQIVYEDSDMTLWGIYPSREAFDEAIREDYRYVSHERTEIRLP
ncbi:MAG: RNA polymerase sigma factor [Clostridia bacterium]|nr:RNA polymerase sigma factor [Clostridia bacterium]